MKELTKKMLRDHKLGLILTSIGILLSDWFFISFYPSLQKIDFDSLLKAYLESIKVAMGLDKININTLEGFVNVEFYSFMWVIIIGGYLIAFATSELTKQVEDGTIESLLSLPISRFKIILTKWLNMVAVSAYLVFLATIPILGFAKLYDISVKADGFVLVGILGFLFFTSIGSLTLALAVLFNERSKAVAIPSVILGFGYLWNSIGQMVDKIKDYMFISIFHYLDTAKVLADKEIGLTSILVLSSIIIASTVFAFYWFTRRDFAI